MRAAADAQRALARPRVGRRRAHPRPHRHPHLRGDGLRSRTTSASACIARPASARPGTAVRSSCRRRRATSSRTTPDVTCVDLGRAPAQGLRAAAASLPVGRSRICRASFPPLRTPEERRTNLPAPPRAAVRSRSELDAIRAMVRRTRRAPRHADRPGGTGKTRSRAAGGRRSRRRFRGRRATSSRCRRFASPSSCCRRSPGRWA